MTRFTSFVLFAEMRTGSNYLEETLNGFADIRCMGEVWNPTFIGHHNTFELLGYDMSRREADPTGLYDALVASSDGALPGFRFFHDHDPRVLDRILPDPAVAKVVLTRNPLDSYVSRKIAAATGQWRLTDARHRRSAKITFDPAEFERMLDELQAFQLTILNALQRTGQTAFYIGYDDINDVEVVNGLAAYLGSEHRIEATSDRLKKQNPGDPEDKVENYAEMREAVARLDRFDLTRTPNFEPRRHAGVPGFIALPDPALLHIPIKCGPVGALARWMARTGGVSEDGLLTGMTQKDLRKWLRQHAGHHSFAVVRHPLARAWVAFNRCILPPDRPAFADLRRVLRKAYKVPLPDGAPGPDFGKEEMRAAFLGFLTFLRGHLAGQTSQKIDAAWATQTAILQGAAQVTLPHRILREDTLPETLPSLARSVGSDAAAYEAEDIDSGSPVALSQIYDDTIETAAFEAYRRDYLNFGFADWTG